jgi:hypothetical protein
MLCKSNALICSEDKFMKDGGGDFENVYVDIP